MTIGPAPLASMPLAARQNVRAVLTDIDDTLTTRGQLTPEAYAAMARLADAGFLVIPVTGRPAGWCDHIARMWPVAAVVGENGAFWMRYDRACHKLLKRFVDDEATRASHRGRIAAIASEIVAGVPGCAIASDQGYRETDLAIDFCEDVPALPRADVERIVSLMRERGMTARVSSIHVNGWFGRYDKLSMVRTVLDEAFSINLELERERFVFVGDSPNDATMFDYFPLAVGVANIARFLDRIATPPAYVTTAEAGAGFAEVAQALIDARA
jgi:HAD superfamily hydrolase (TIGR01484 family)